MLPRNRTVSQYFGLKCRSRYRRNNLYRSQSIIFDILQSRGILHIRRHLAATPLFKGIPNFRDTRIAMLQANTVDELTAILDKIECDILPEQI